MDKYDRGIILSQVVADRLSSVIQDITCCVTKLGKEDEAHKKLDADLAKVNHNGLHCNWDWIRAYLDVH